ncbi:peptide-methionine (R)-S-oxide reductase, partial [Candidatus Woesebacteria bacterium]|nr:peptide-methionine (R)-S-oxide reductase [Candidatus Woesebacteria bacterium]
MTTQKNSKLKYAWILILVPILLILGILYIRNQELPISDQTTIIAGSFDPEKFKTEKEWESVLSAEEYHILREAGTELPFTGALNNEKRSGTYYSVGCDIPLFRS